MIQLSEDLSFHYEAIRTLGLTRYGGADVAEILALLPKIPPGDFEAWYLEWHNLALRILSTVDGPKTSCSPATLRDVYFRASHYFFVASFYLHGNQADPRGYESWDISRKYYNVANEQLDIPGVHVTVDTPHGFTVPIIVYRASQASAANPRPTLLVGGGFDSNMEETMHVFGFPALERGYNVILYEGPGQPTLLHEQRKGFIPDWEKVVTPVVDYIHTHKSNSLNFIDTAKMGLIGMSLGGYLAARAAAFEPRLAAVICIDGVWSFEETFFSAFASMPELKNYWDEGNERAFNEAFDSVATSPRTNFRWIHDQTKFSFQMENAYEIMRVVRQMGLSGIADKIRMPAFLGDAEDDIFFLGQPPIVAREIGDNATLVRFGADQAAGAHCQSGALTHLNREYLEWFAGVLGDK